MIIQFLDGTEIDLNNYNCRCLRPHIPSLSPNHETEILDTGRQVIVDTTFTNRSINPIMLLKPRDIHDFYLLRDDLHALFIRQEEFYIIFKRVPYIKWLVKLASPLNLTPSNRMQEFTLDFITLNRYGESIADTSTIKEWNVDKWGWNRSIDWDEDLQYTFNESNFIVKNLGNVEIDPRESDLKIVVKGEFLNGIIITNERTNDIYQYYGPIFTADTLTLDGIRTFKNEESDFNNTNHKLLTLAPGENPIMIEGGTLESIAFSFRFLYK